LIVLGCMDNNFNFMRKISKYIVIFCLALLFFPGHVFSFDFSADSGLNSAAKKTGHSDLKIFKDSSSIESSVGLIIQTIISFIGVVFVILLVYGGILWMTAKGNDQQVDKAKKIIVESIIGLFVVVSAYAISILVISAFNFQ